jgi:KUP system potassium uptake protein
MDTSIQFADDTVQQTRSRTSHGIGGVVPLRHRSRSRRRTNSLAVDKLNELEDAEDEDAGLRHEGDYKKAQVRNLHEACWMRVNPV